MEPEIQPGHGPFVPPLPPGRRCAPRANSANRATAKRLADARKALYRELRRLWSEVGFVVTRCTAPLISELLAVAEDMHYRKGYRSFRFNGATFRVHVSPRGRLVVADAEGLELVSAPALRDGG